MTQSLLPDAVEALIRRYGVEAVTEEVTRRYVQSQIAKETAVEMPPARLRVVPSE